MVVSNPIARLSPDQADGQYLAIAKWYGRKMAMSHVGINQWSSVLRLANGVVITYKVCFGLKEIFISVPGGEYTEKIVSEMYPHGFLTHPRNGSVRGFQFPGTDAARTPAYGLVNTGKGYTIKKNVLTDDGDSAGEQEGEPYPLIDDDEKTWLFDKLDNKKNVWITAPTKQNSKWYQYNGDLEYGIKTTPPGTLEYPKDLNYGNVDWKGPAMADPRDRKILTYKGNPSRYWPVNQFTDIPGLSSVDHSVEGLLNSYEYMTVFGDKVYSGGRVLSVMPWLYHPLNSSQGTVEANHQNAQVLGAAIRESDGVLLCIVKTCYNSYPRVKASPTGLPDDTEGLVSTWQVWQKDSSDVDMLIKDWYEDTAGADSAISTYNTENPLNKKYTLVEVKDPGRGYWVEVIARKAGDIQGGWKRLKRIAMGSSMPNCNFFFSEDGTKACTVMYASLWEIVITGETVTDTTTEVGIFKQELNTSVSKPPDVNNYGTQDPNLGGIFGGVFRVGLKVGDWITKTEGTSTYSSTKSGSTILAADYKGNVLTKMTATINGSETISNTTLYGSKWGHTGLPDNFHTSFNGDAYRTPGIRIQSDPFDAFGSWTGGVCVNVGGLCKGTVTVNGKKVDENGCVDLGELCLPCLPSGSYYIVVATAKDEVTGRKMTQTKQYFIETGRGSWVVTRDDRDGFLSGSPRVYGSYLPTCGGVTFRGSPLCSTVKECMPNMNGGGPYSDTGYVTVTTATKITRTRTQTGSGYALTYNYDSSYGPVGGSMTYVPIGQICNGLWLVEWRAVSNDIRITEYICPPC